jgi:hypothetical protein
LSACSSLLLAFLGSTAAGDETIANVKPQLLWSTVSGNGTYRVSIHPASDEITIGRLHNWVINVATPSGQPVFPARIVMGGGMQGHGHGLPTQPQITSYEGDGSYLIEGLRFSMEGLWRLSFFIESAAGSDRADVDIELSF